MTSFTFNSSRKKVYWNVEVSVDSYSDAPVVAKVSLMVEHYYFMRQQFVREAELVVSKVFESDSQHDHTRFRGLLMEGGVLGMWGNNVSFNVDENPEINDLNDCYVFLAKTIDENLYQWFSHSNSLGVSVNYDQQYQGV